MSFGVDQVSHPIPFVDPQEVESDAELAAGFARPQVLRRATSQILSYYASSDAGREYTPSKSVVGGTPMSDPSSSSDYSDDESDSDDECEDMTLTLASYAIAKPTSLATSTTIVGDGHGHKINHAMESTGHNNLSSSSTYMDSRTNGNKLNRRMAFSDPFAHNSESSNEFNSTNAKQIDKDAKHEHKPHIHFPSFNNHHFEVPLSISPSSPILASNTERSGTSVPSFSELTQQRSSGEIDCEQTPSVVESSLSAPVLGHRRRTSSRSLGGNDKRRVAIVELKQGDVVMNGNGVNSLNECMRTVDLKLEARQIPDGVRREHSSGPSDCQLQQKHGPSSFTLGRAFGRAGTTFSSSSLPADSSTAQSLLDPPSISATSSPLSRSSSSASRSSTSPSNWVNSPSSSSSSSPPLVSSSGSSPNSFNAGPSALLARRGFANGTFALVAPPDASPSAYTNLSYFTPPLSAPSSSFAVEGAPPHVKIKDTSSAGHEVVVAVRNIDVLAAAEKLSSSHQDTRSVNSTEPPASPPTSKFFHHQRSQSEAVGSKENYNENNSYTQNSSSKISNGDFEFSNNNSIGGRVSTATRPTHQLRKSSRDIGIVGTSVTISPTSGRFIMDLRLEESKGHGEDATGALNEHGTLPLSPIFQTPSAGSDGALTPEEKSSNAVSLDDGNGSASVTSTTKVTSTTNMSGNINGTSLGSPSPFSREMREKRRTQLQQQQPVPSTSNTGSSGTVSPLSRVFVESKPNNHLANGSSNVLRGTQNEKAINHVSAKSSTQTAFAHVTPTTSGAASPSSAHSPRTPAQFDHTHTRQEPRSPIQSLTQSQASSSQSTSQSNTSSYIPPSPRQKSKPSSPPSSVDSLHSSTAIDPGKNSYLYYQPGIHATAGPLPPPPRQTLPPGLKSNLNGNRDSPPPRPPRLHAPGSGSGTSTIAKKSSYASIGNEQCQQQIQPQVQTEQTQAGAKQDKQEESTSSPGITPSTLSDNISKAQHTIPLKQDERKSSHGHTGSQHKREGAFAGTSVIITNATPPRPIPGVQEAQTPSSLAHKSSMGDLTNSSVSKLSSVTEGEVAASALNTDKKEAVTSSDNVDKKDLGIVPMKRDDSRDSERVLYERRSAIDLKRESSRSTFKGEPAPSIARSASSDYSDDDSVVVGRPLPGLQTSSLGPPTSATPLSATSAHSHRTASSISESPSQSHESAASKLTSKMLDLAIKRFSALPRTPSRLSVSRLSQNSQQSITSQEREREKTSHERERTTYEVRNGGVPSSIQPPRARPVFIAKIRSPWPDAMKFGDVLAGKSPLERAIGYAHKINELANYDPGLGEWVVNTKYNLTRSGASSKRKSMSPNLETRSPAERSFTFQPRHPSRGSIGSEMTFPKRVDAYVATDLLQKPSEDVLPKGPPPLPYPTLANGPPPSVRSKSTGGGFFASIGRRSSISKKGEKNGSASGTEKGPNKLLSKRNHQNVMPHPPANTPPNPRPVQISASPSLPGGPRAPPGLTDISNKSGTSNGSSAGNRYPQHQYGAETDTEALIGGSGRKTRRLSLKRSSSVVPSVARSVVSAYTMANVNGGNAYHNNNNYIPQDNFEGIEEQLSRLSDLLPHANRNILAGYLRRANGQDILAIGRYLDDEKSGLLPRN